MAKSSSSLKHKCVKVCTFGMLPSKKTCVSVIRLTGIIADGGMVKKGLSFDALEDQIEKAFEPKNVKAVALQINSPGGSPVQSELIFRRIRHLSEEKNIPVYAFTEDLAASGGYWLACAADEIFCIKTSIIGSIGVISSGFGFVQTMKKLGVERRIHTQGKNKSILDPFSPEKQQDIEILKNLQKDAHDSFIAMVKTRRNGKIKEDDYDYLFTGEFWSGVKAVDLGLVDGIGDMHNTLREKFGDDIKLLRISKPKGLLQRKLGMSINGLVDSLTDSIFAKLEETALWGKYK